MAVCFLHYLKWAYHCSFKEFISGFHSINIEYGYMLVSIDKSHTNRNSLESLVSIKVKEN